MRNKLLTARHHTVTLTRESKASRVDLSNWKKRNRDRGKKFDNQGGSPLYRAGSQNFVTHTRLNRPPTTVDSGCLLLFSATDIQATAAEGSNSCFLIPGLPGEQDIDGRNRFQACGFQLTAGHSLVRLSLENPKCTPSLRIRISSSPPFDFASLS